MRLDIPINRRSHSDLEGETLKLSRPLRPRNSRLILTKGVIDLDGCESVNL